MAIRVTARSVATLGTLESAGREPPAHQRR
jgi:hypothetical protein